MSRRRRDAGGLVALLVAAVLAITGCEEAEQGGTVLATAPSGAATGDAFSAGVSTAADDATATADDDSPATGTAGGAHADASSVDSSNSNGGGAGSSAGKKSDATPDRTSTLAVLSTLAIKGRSAKTGYSRDQFGPAWLDADRNGCDTRNDMLRRDLAQITVKSGTNGCVVLTGVLDDDYTGKRIDHVRGNSKIDIDHRVALSNAWQTGASQWSLAKRAAFANDPLNLTATDAGANRSKGDGDAATWLPPNKAYRCDYVATQVAVKAKYGLWVTQPEYDAIVRVLTACPGHQLPADATRAPTEVDHNLKPVATSTPQPKATAKASPKPKATQAPKPKATSKASPKPKPKATPTPKPKPKPKPTPTPTVPKVFKNCTEARAAGAAPVYRGDPGYGKHLDRDGDGIGCE
ncbi:DUF1524 domain-containing protein [Nocardioides sp. AE5]|uniref:GmrSD restriction endonuclease domain-containing protein n=1 Tax=Nocardioides sp. AE5 TaxID=2962573 RepID=UPI0028824FBB|nr:DUF1524 domain-containing protein [Nocardioides sp. AE5]MDT0200721.1 excalibur calcium-binding domain-containing protein [Nocardioides sp. AE5]